MITCSQLTEIILQVPALLDPALPVEPGPMPPDLLPLAWSTLQVRLTY